MKVMKKLFLALSCLSLFSLMVPRTSVLAAQNSVQGEEITEETKEQLKTFEHLSEEELITLLTAVEELPEEYMEPGREEDLINHFSEYGIDYQIEGYENEKSNNADDMLVVKSAGIWDTTKCVAAIGWLVGSTVLGIGLLRKLKNFISAAGGIQAAATALVAIAKQGATTENINRFGTALVETASVILGIQAIQDNC